MLLFLSLMPLSSFFFSSVSPPFFLFYFIFLFKPSPLFPLYPTPFCHYLLHFIPLLFVLFLFIRFLRLMLHFLCLNPLVLVEKKNSFHGVISTFVTFHTYLCFFFPFLSFLLMLVCFVLFFRLFFSSPPWFSFFFLFLTSS